MRGEAKGGKKVSFGEYGLQATTWPLDYKPSNRRLARIAMTRYMKRGGRFGLRSSTQIACC